MRASVCRGYDSTTLIADTSKFGKQLGIDFGNAFRPSAVERPGQAWWMLLPQVVVDHGPVIYTESPSDVDPKIPESILETYHAVCETPSVSPTRMNTGS